jgi:hypothetical protein
MVLIEEILEKILEERKKTKIKNVENPGVICEVKNKKGLVNNHYQINLNYSLFYFLHFGLTKPSRRCRGEDIGTGNVHTHPMRHRPPSRFLWQTSLVRMERV